MMDVLVQARAKLARLESKAQELVEQLLGVRVAVFAQRTKISELIRHKSPIQRLPTELLLYILILDVCAHPDHERKQELAGVSRRWRDIILDSPIFWRSIAIPRLTTSAIETHLRRSGGSLLDIVIGVDLDDLGRSYEGISPRLDVIKPNAHRWGFLDVSHVENQEGQADSDDDEDIPVGEFLIKAIGHLELPLLKRASIQFFGNIAYPDFLSQTRAPSLEHLELRCPTWNNFLPPPTLKSLVVSFAVESAPEPLFTRLIPTQTLTTLSLGGNFDNLSFQPDSIYFPVLNTLTLTFRATNGFMQAIIAPNLECFTYFCFDEEENPPSVVFAGLGSKFTTVHRVSFPVTSVIGQFPTYDHSPLCQAFPNVCHARLNPRDLIDLFTPSRRGDESIRGAIDLWRNLTSLTVGGLHSRWWEALNLLTRWLMQRRKLGLPLLHVKISCSLSDDFGFLYGCLRDHCLLEFDDSSMKKAHISALANSSPRMVSILCLPLQ